MMGQGGQMPPYMPPVQHPSPAQRPPQQELPSLPMDKEPLGEMLFPLVEKKNAAYAAKITGMLLEMEIDQIHNIIRDPNQLDKWISEAMKVNSYLTKL